MEILKIDISEIKEYKNNAKLHPKEQIEQIKKSIKEFGNNDPIAIDENNIIIEGHGRYLALKQLGYKEVDVIKLTHLSEEQKKAYILTHNKLTMNTNFDVDILNEELDEILNIDMSDFGFDILEDEKEVNQDTDYEEIDDKSVIIVEASSEKELEELYDEFVERGITCRVSIL
ncbi:TPA: ParB/Srx family N-terminal domain-containing protein [Streptococcus pyogenes]|uniref:Phage DNA methylase n=1 Tax=Streptococcus pyogenes TaxID=1314 RepID=A0A7G1JCY9_STRPY|nr:ParB/Srx family N-terminal domain-containing protein [Streptococcus pyogenes]ESU93961.1 ParB-like protein [Streptococcus pyogenes GA03747]HER4608081.1 ParB N-terminal domain-containing protein [Streptococcus pyogenes NGAS532]HER4682890.1 ParB N-terminal domain-containing protein [Streptococcus pyogenes NGAS358]HER4685603.1 ParB N-terminal domain-containing protein [Streptococcus pyogenes NGAS353]HER4687061.1 ParB N-terminal domain-containing protein [Streptococcus pyogenes NGAS364]HER46928